MLKKRIITLLLVLCTLISSFVSTDITYANSNNMRSAYLNLMSGKNSIDSKAVENLEYDDLRVIALFLSNFYIPFGTSLDSDSEETNKEVMIEILMGLGFDKTASENLIDMTYAASLNSAQPIYACVSEAPANSNGDHRWGMGTNYNDPGIGVTTVRDNATYKKYVGEPVYVDESEGGRAGAGSTIYTPATLWQWTTDASNVTKGDMSWDTYKTDTGSWGSSYYFKKDDGSMQKVFTWTSVTNDMYISMLSKDNNGYASGNTIYQTGGLGNAVTNIPLGKTSDYSTDDDTLAAVSIFTQNLYVDWVGNIIADFGSERVIIYPACVNPYVFSDITGDVQDINFNLVSTWGIRFLNMYGNYDSNSYKTTDGKGSLGNNIPMQFVSTLGQKTTASWDSEFGFWTGGAATEIKNKYKEWGLLTDEDNSDWEDTKCNLIFKDYTIDNTKALGSIISYKSIPTTKTFVTDDEVWAEKTDSSFISWSLFDGDVTTKGYFDSSAKFENINSSFDSMLNFLSSDKALLSDIFITYMFAYANSSASTYDDKCYVNMKFNDVFPKVTGELTWTATDNTADEIQSFIYYLLHPTEGVHYVASLIKSKVGGIFISWHEDMVGATSSNSSTGMTKYIGFSGYATSPALKEIEFMSVLLENYNSLIVFLIIFMTLILLLYILVGSLSVQRGILGVLIFSVFAFIPPVAIDTTVNTINTACDSIYSSKFDYWALCQMQEYIGDLNRVVEAGTAFDYITSSMEIGETGAIESSNSFGSTRLKWMSPKKVNELASASNELSSNLDDTFSDTLLGMASNMMGSANSVEEYVGDGSLYLYRDISDIYLVSSTSYNLYQYFNYANTISSTDNCNIGEGAVSGSVESNWIGNTSVKLIKYPSGESLQSYVLANNTYSSKYSGIPSYIKETSSRNAITRGFLVNTGSGTGNYNYYNEDKTLAASLLINYNDTVGNIQESYTNIQNYISGATMNLSITSLKSDVSNALTSGKAPKYFFGLNPEVFDLGTHDFVKNKDKAITTGGNPYSDLSGYYFALYSESPFYYFSYNTRDALVANDLYSYDYESLTNGNDFYKLFLQNNQGYFFNLSDNAGDGYGELRDFMNMHDLFYYVIPMMEVGNDLVYAFDEVWGMNTYDDCSLSINSAGEISYDGDFSGTLSELLQYLEDNNATEEEIYKVWHDYNVWTLWNCYCPWLDTMSDCKYAESEKISVMGETFVVKNPMDPTSYYEVDDSGKIVAGRYMIFSRSEMKYYGLDEGDLTNVERKIIELQDNVYANTIKLMNYKTLSNEVLVNAYSMIQLFEFNKVFSQSSLLGEDFILYPQGYELKAFTYDAYMRLILSESSGENLMTDNNESIYERILSKTSLFFGLLLIVNDVIAVYLIPILKLVFLVLIFFISVALIISASIKLEFNVVTVMWKSILAPLCSYGATSIGMAYIVSLFMSNGAEGVTKTSTTISLGDPTMVVIVMIIINVAVMVLYWKICKKSFMDFKTYVTAIFDNISATVVGAVRGMASGVAGSIGGIASGVGKFNRNRRAKRDSENLSAIAGTAQQRGIDNSPRSGKTAINTSLAGASALGAVASASNEVKAVSGMNKYDRKALGKTNDSINEIQSKYDRLSHKADVARNNGNTRLAERYDKKASSEHEKLIAKKRYASNIISQGRFGAARTKAVGDIASGINRGKAIGKNITSGVYASRLGRLTGDTVGGVTRAGKNVKEFGGKAVDTTKKVGKSIVDGSAGRNIALGIKKGVVTGRDKVVSGVKGGINATKRVATVNRDNFKSSYQASNPYSKKRNITRLKNV